jgi:hypothetical protein
MVIENSRYCNLCHGIILFGQKHVQFRAPGSDGKSSFDYTHFHHRFKGDCWDKKARISTQKVELNSPIQHSAAS